MELSHDHIPTLNTLTLDASRLGERYLDLAEAGDDREAARLYLDCLKAFRLGVGLTCRLMEPPRVAGAASGSLPAERDVEREPGDREPRDRDHERDRDDERVSLPAFLESLGVVARKAEARDLPPDARADVAAIKSFLAERRAPQAGLAVLARPAARPARNARERLLGSAARPPPKPNSS